MNGRFLSKKIRSQMGFTLLELLVVIAVIGVLASLAVPRLQSQVQKARFISVINSAAPVKAAAEVCFQKTGDLSKCTAGANGIPSDVNKSGDNDSVVTAYDAAKSELLITAQGNPDNAADGVVQTYVLQGSAVSGGLTWAVNGTCVNSNFCK